MDDPRPEVVTTRRIRAAIAFLLHLPFAVVFVGPLVALSTWTRRSTPRHGLPRVVWGPTPLLNNVYWSRALAARGFPSTTVAYGLFRIHSAETFDRVRPAPIRSLPRSASLLSYAYFARALREFDVIITNFDGGFLRDTPLAGLEPALLRIARKAVICIPYGSDVAVEGHLGPTEDLVFRDYPWLRDEKNEIRRRVDRWCKHATTVIKTPQVGYLPRADIHWFAALAIDTETWKPAERRLSKSGSVKVVHAPNHRDINGTDRVISAVESLKAGGLPVELVLLEGAKNDEVLTAMRGSDIAVDRLVRGFGLFAVEAMSCGLAVLSDTTWITESDFATVVPGDLPVVSATPETIHDRLRELVLDSALRESVQARSREYACNRHSIAAIGMAWAAIVTDAAQNARIRKLNRPTTAN